VNLSKKFLSSIDTCKLKSYAHKKLANQKLEQRVRERTRQLGDANSALATNYRMLQTKLHQTAHAGHSLVATLRGMVYLLQKDNGNGSQYLERLSETSDQLGSVFSNLEDGLH
jgi:nitrate/nitrite-specific signal transduction histidine kinase